MKKALLALLLCFGTSALGQAYPAKPVRVVVPFPAGGITDILARLLAQRLGEAWGQTLFVENRSGAGGNIGVVYLVKDLVPVINVASSPNMIITAQTGPATLRELIEKSKATGLIYGSAGAGTTPHLTAEYLFKNLAGLNVTHVPYKGAAPAVNAAIAGEVVAVSVAMPTAVPHIKSGRLRGLAVMSSTRVAALPEVPTVQELGFPGFEDYTWVGVFVPTGTPPGVVAKINTDINAFLGQADSRERLASFGFDPVGGTSEGFAKYINAEVTKWAKVIRETGAKIE